jgi:hypothetical protein
VSFSNRLQFTWVAIEVLKNLQVHGTVNYVKNYYHLEALAHQLSMLGRSIFLSWNVAYVVALLVLLGSLQVVNGSMPSALR